MHSTSSPFLHPLPIPHSPIIGKTVLKSRYPGVSWKLKTGDLLRQSVRSLESVWQWADYKQSDSRMVCWTSTATVRVYMQGAHDT
jgi:hypothetical protein